MWEKVTETGGTMLACNYGMEGGKVMYVLEEIWALTARIEINWEQLYNKTWL